MPIKRSQAQQAYPALRFAHLTSNHAIQTIGKDATLYARIEELAVDFQSRDVASGLHAWVVKKMRTCERYFMLACTSRSTIWDAIAGNTGQMMFCLQGSVAMSMGFSLDLSKSSNADEREFEGGFVLEPRPGCYKGVVVIDGNSLYGSIMSKLGIFIDRCAPGSTALELARKLGRDVAQVLEHVQIDDVVEHKDLILMRTEDAFLSVKRGPVTITNVVLDHLINSRKKAKSLGDSVRAAARKLLTTSVYGAMGSRHGVISSKTWAEITTYAARYYLRQMIDATNSCGYVTLYGDTDSIFVWVKGETEIACMTAGVKVKNAIYKFIDGSVFASVGADIKGNYKSIVISAKKKYEAVRWDDTLETKGLAIVKDSLPIVRYALYQTMEILNNSDTNSRKTRMLIELVGKIMVTLQGGKLPLSY